jgi:hypothetical protein
MFNLPNLISLTTFVTIWWACAKEIIPPVVSGLLIATYTQAWVYCKIKEIKDKKK